MTPAHEAPSVHAWVHAFRPKEDTVSQPKVTEINVPYPESTGPDQHLRLHVGACRLRIAPAAPGAPDTWVRGTYRDPSGLLPSTIEQEGTTVRISQQAGRVALSGRFWGDAPTFELALGTSKPYMLTIETGASELTGDFGSLPLTRLVIRQGAGKATLDFSTPCTQLMSLLDVGSGAVEMRVKHLANANAAEVILNGGAASYTFAFDGMLQRDAHARITTGMSAVEIAVPATTAAKVASESFLGSLQVDQGFSKREGAFWTPAAIEGKRPVLSVQTSVALGSLRLRIG
jgi:hypothetical protein